MLSKLTKLSLAIILVFGISTKLDAQIVVEQTLTIEQYVNEFLLGEGVTATNITYTGSESQIGTMSGGEGTIFPIASGLVLATTGLDPAFSETPIDDPVDGEPDLLSVANSVPPLINQNFNVTSVNDVAILEFDFVPNGDTMSFKYCFGSDEYLGWVNSQYNDIFAFFLSGPGLAGPYASPAGFPDGAINIAQIPGSNPPLPITISSVNDVTNPQYYIDNPAVAPDFENIDIGLNGFTDTLRAVSAVQCGELYHIKIAIADGSDNFLESVVVLEEGSFSSDLAIQTTLELNIGVTANILYENCGEGTLVFQRYGDLDAATTVELVTSGSAINGVDYTPIPPEVFFNAGDSLASITISAIPDGVEEGVESVTIDVTNTAISACGVNVTTNFNFDIFDDPEELALTGSDYFLDCGDSVLIGNIVTGGYGEYTYAWYANGVVIPGLTESEFYAKPGVTTDYLCHVDDICNAGSIEANYVITVPVYPPLEVDIDDSIELICLEEVQLSVNTSGGGDGNYSYTWFQDTLLATGYTINYTGYASNQVTVEISDGCGAIATDVMQVNVPVVPIVIDLSEQQTVCKGQSVFIDALVSGGEPPYIYQWSNGLTNVTNFTAVPQVNQSYELSIQDACFNSESASTNVLVSEVHAHYTLSMLDYYGVSVTNQTQSNNGGEVTYLWDFGDGFTSDEEDLTHMYTDISDHTISLVASSGLGCSDSIAFSITAPRPIYIPSSFSPNEDGINDLFFVSGFEMDEYEINIFDRLGNVVFHSFDIEETWNGKGAMDESYYSGIDVYNYIIDVRPKAGEREKISGSLTVIR